MQGGYEYNQGGGYNGGGQQYPSGGNVTQGGSYPAGGGYSHEEDLRGAADAAVNHSNGSDTDRGFFSDILSAVAQQKGNLANQNLDEGAAVQHHQQYFGNGGGGGGSGSATSNGMGAAAAMQALKMFMGNNSGGSSGGMGNASGNSGSNSGGGGGGGYQSQNQFIGMAMSEASKLFDHQQSQGNVANGASKQSAVQKAGEMAWQMYMKSQGGSSGGSGGGGSSSGGMGSLLSMASKFM